MPRAVPKLLKLYGVIWLNTETGEPYLSYYRDGTVSVPIKANGSNWSLKDYAIFEQVKETYGTKDGAKVRKFLAVKISQMLDNAQWGFQPMQ